MKLARLLDTNLQNALKKLNAQSLPLRTSFALKGITKRIDEELLKYEECRKEGLEKAGKRDDKGELLLDENNNVVLESEARIAFISSLNELVNTEVDVGKLSIDQLGDISISADDLMHLDGIIE